RLWLSQEEEFAGRVIRFLSSTLWLGEKCAALLAARMLVTAVPFFRAGIQAYASSTEPSSTRLNDSPEPEAAAFGAACFAAAAGLASVLLSPSLMRRRRLFSESAFFSACSNVILPCLYRW